MVNNLEAVKNNFFRFLSYNCYINTILYLGYEEILIILNMTTLKKKKKINYFNIII